MFTCFLVCWFASKSGSPRFPLNIIIPRNSKSELCPIIGEERKWRRWNVEKTSCAFLNYYIIPIIPLSYFSITIEIHHFSQYSNYCFKRFLFMESFGISKKSAMRNAQFSDIRLQEYTERWVVWSPEYPQGVAILIAMGI